MPNIAKKLLSVVFVVLSPGFIGADEPQTPRLTPDDEKKPHYVEVRDEPYHRHRFENARIRLYDVLIPPGETSLFHRHSRNTVYVVIQATKVSNRLPGSSALEVALRQSAVSYLPQREKPLIHAVGNIGDTDARLVGVELIESARDFPRPVIETSGYTLEDSFPGVRSYRVNLAPGTSTQPLPFESDGVLIAITGLVSSVEHGDQGSRTILEPGDWRWLQKGEIHAIQNTGSSGLEAVVYELP